MSAVMISMIKVKNKDKLQEYMQKVMQLGTQYDAEMLFRGPVSGVVKGEADHDIAVVVRFPSLEAIDALFASEEYQPLINIREEASDMQIIKYQTPEAA